MRIVKWGRHKTQVLFSALMNLSMRKKGNCSLKRLSSPTAKRADFPSWFIKQLFHKDVSKLRHFHIFHIWGETNVMVFSRHRLSCISSGKTSHSTTYVVQKFLSDSYCRLIFWPRQKIQGWETWKLKKNCKLKHYRGEKISKFQ